MGWKQSSGTLWVPGFGFPKPAVPSGSVALLGTAACLELSPPPSLSEVSSDPA